MTKKEFGFIKSFSNKYYAVCVSPPPLVCPLPFLVPDDEQPLLFYLLTMPDSPHTESQPRDTRSPPYSSIPSPSSPGQSSNAQLASLLADALKEVENLRRELATTKKRTEDAEMPYPVSQTRNPIRQTPLVYCRNSSSVL